jgi:folate-dependent phosphoribosylglycinamide formyltransferase PurN
LHGLINPALVLTNNPNAGITEKANRHGIPVAVVRRQAELEGAKQQRKFGEDILAALHENRIQMIAQLGWLPLTPEDVVETYHNRIINQHPAPLDPEHPAPPEESSNDFGGRGMYGERAQTAVLRYSARTFALPNTESNVHRVTPGIDEGDVLGRYVLPRRVEAVLLEHLPDYQNLTTLDDWNGETENAFKAAAHQLGQELLPLEHTNVVLTLRRIGRDFAGFANGTMDTIRRQDPLVPPEHRDALIEAKQYAVNLYRRK